MPTLLLGKGEEKSGGIIEITILGDAFEAFLGALPWTRERLPWRNSSIRSWFPAGVGNFEQRDRTTRPAFRKPCKSTEKSTLLTWSSMKWAPAHDKTFHLFKSWPIKSHRSGQVDVPRISRTGRWLKNARGRSLEAWHSEVEWKCDSSPQTRQSYLWPEWGCQLSPGMGRHRSCWAVGGSSAKSLRVARCLMSSLRGQKSASPGIPQLLGHFGQQQWFHRGSGPWKSPLPAIFIDQEEAKVPDWWQESPPGGMSTTSLYDTGLGRDSSSFPKAGWKKF